MPTRVYLTPRGIKQDKMEDADLSRYLNYQSVPDYHEFWEQTGHQQEEIHLEDIKPEPLAPETTCDGTTPQTNHPPVETTPLSSDPYLNTCTTYQPSNSSIQSPLPLSPYQSTPSPRPTILKIPTVPLTITRHLYSTSSPSSTGPSRTRASQSTPMDITASEETPLSLTKRDTISTSATAYDLSSKKNREPSASTTSDNILPVYAGVDKRRQPSKECSIKRAKLHTVKVKEAEGSHDEDLQSGLTDSENEEGKLPANKDAGKISNFKVTVTHNAEDDRPTLLSGAHLVTVSLFTQTSMRLMMGSFLKALAYLNHHASENIRQRLPEAWTIPTRSSEYKNILLLEPWVQLNLTVCQRGSYTRINNSVTCENCFKREHPGVKAFNMRTKHYMVKRGRGITGLTCFHCNKAVLTSRPSQECANCVIFLLNNPGDNLRRCQCLEIINHVSNLPKPPQL